MDNDNNDELAIEYGVQAATISNWKTDSDNQWSIWHEQCDQLGSCSGDFDSMCEPFHICCDCGVILFVCDFKWVDSSRKEPPYRAVKFENLSYGLMIVTMDKNGVTKVACCRHCGENFMMILNHNRLY